MGVFRPSSCLIKVGVATRGLRSSEGYEADRGVFKAESWGRVAAMMDGEGGEEGGEEEEEQRLPETGHCKGCRRREPYSTSEYRVVVRLATRSDKLGGKC
jgi:hypothetical protein